MTHVNMNGSPRTLTNNALAVTASSDEPLTFWERLSREGPFVQPKVNWESLWLLEYYRILYRNPFPQYRTWHERLDEIHCTQPTSH